MSRSQRYQIQQGQTSNIKSSAIHYRDSILRKAIMDNVITSEKQIKQIATQHNMAYLEYNVNEVKESSLYGNIGYFIAHSKISTRHVPINPLTDYGFVGLKLKGRAFKHIDVSKTKDIECGASHPRQGDSEAKLFEKLAEILHPHSVGTVNLYTEYEPCLSCDYEIIQFLEKFPRVKLIISYDLDYN